ncbi:MAG: pilus assembly protein [Planctomycetes bacterium]|nr:pilus assembly protein [Planctomycetota bacterium]
MQKIRLIPRKQPRGRSGAALVELAIALPVLFLITFICIDFGSSAGAYLVLSNAARAGADYGATHRFTSDSAAAWEARMIRAIQQEMANAKRYAPGQLQTSISTSNNGDGTIQVIVDLRYTYQTIVSWTAIPATIPLHSRIEMRQYQ